MGVGIEARNVNAWFGTHQALHDISLSIAANHATAIIGPSGCGKSTFVRCLNRMHEEVYGARVEGNVLVEGVDIYAADIRPMYVRRHVGMVFQQPNVLPTRGIFDNVAIGVRLNGLASGSEVSELVERSLRQAALWDEVKDRLHAPAASLSGGQQQRLCIARTIAVNPEVILMDEPCSALDPIATAKIEDLIDELRETYAIVIVTHSMQQAARVSQRTAYFHLGDLIEVGETDRIFTNPRHKLTEDYITGRFG